MQYQAVAIVLMLAVLHQGSCLPSYSSSSSSSSLSSSGNDIDIDGNYHSSVGGGGGRGVDYHTVVGHFKDFFMYLPVMMTTLKETMSGFPKFAEGMRILTSGKGRIDGEDCKCSQNAFASGASSNEVLDNSSRFG